MVVAFGLGPILGDVLLLRWRPPRALFVAGIALVFASCQAAVYGSGLALAPMCVLQCLAAIGVSLFFTLWEVSLQEHVPSEALSRVSSFDYLSATALMPVSTALAGPLAEAVGVQETLLGMSVLGVAVRAGLPRRAAGARAAPRRLKARAPGYLGGHGGRTHPAGRARPAAPAPASGAAGCCSSAARCSRRAGRCRRSSSSWWS